MDIMGMEDQQLMHDMEGMVHMQAICGHMEEYNNGEDLISMNHGNLDNLVHALTQDNLSEIMH